MNYPTVLNGKEIILTDTDSTAAMDNDIAELKLRYNPNYVTIEELTPTGVARKFLRVTLRARTHYLTSREDRSPKTTDSITFFVEIFPGYPIKSVHAYYPNDKYLASPNVFPSGDCCLDGWTPFSSTLTGTVDKLLIDAVHNPSGTLYGSAANHYMIDWHKRGVASGEFPTLPLKQLYRPETPPPVPSHSSGNAAVSRRSPPPVPHHGSAAVRTAPPPVPAHH